MRGLALPVMIGLILLGLVGLFGCQRETTPPLIQVVELSPREVEAGDHLSIAGVGFPEGKVAHVAFRGDLYRPGVPPLRDVEIDVSAVVVSGMEIDVPFAAAIEKLFAGTGDHAAHTTFSGELNVAFAASSVGAPPVEGTLHDMWLDVRPPAPHGAAAEAAASEGERTLAFLGTKADPTPLPAGGILIQAIEPNSRAEAARLLAGDVVTEFDGVRVLSTRDLAAVPGEKTAWLKIRRGGSPHEEIAHVSLLGLAPPPVATLLGPMLVLGLASIVLLFFFAPTPTAIAWIERRISERLRTRAHATIVARTIWRETGLFDSVSSTYVFFGLASAILALLPVARALGAFEIDVGILFVVAHSALATVGLLSRAFPDSRLRRRSRGLGVVARVVSIAIPKAAAVVAVVMMTGSLRLEDIVRAQGGWPWHWAAFESPIAFALLVIWIVTEFVQCDDERANLVVLSGVAVALFLGGWQLPGMAPEQMDAHLGWMVLGAMLFVLKSWLLVAFVVGARWALPTIRTEQVISSCWRYYVPLSLFLLMLTPLWVVWAPGPSAEMLIGVILLALTSASVVHVVTRVRYFLGEVASEPELDPFL